MIDGTASPCAATIACSRAATTSLSGCLADSPSICHSMADPLLKHETTSHISSSVAAAASRDLALTGNATRHSGGMAGIIWLGYSVDVARFRRLRRAFEIEKRLCRLDKCVHDLLVAGVLELDVELAGVDGDDPAVAEFLMEHPRSDSEGLFGTAPRRHAFGAAFDSQRVDATARAQARSARRSGPWRVRQRIAPCVLTGCARPKSWFARHFDMVGRQLGDEA